MKLRFKAERSFLKKDNNSSEYKIYKRNKICEQELRSCNRNVNVKRALSSMKVLRSSITNFTFHHSLFLNVYLNTTWRSLTLCLFLCKMDFLFPPDVCRNIICWCYILVLLIFSIPTESSKQLLCVNWFQCLIFNLNFSLYYSTMDIWRSLLNLFSLFIIH